MYVSTWGSKALISGYLSITTGRSDYWFLTCLTRQVLPCTSPRLYPGNHAAAPCCSLRLYHTELMLLGCDTSLPSSSPVWDPQWIAMCFVPLTGWNSSSLILNLALHKPPAKQVVNNMLHPALIRQREINKFPTVSANLLRGSLHFRSQNWTQLKLISLKDIYQCEVSGFPWVPRNLCRECT